MTYDLARQLQDLDAAVQQLFSQVERLRQHVEILHIECAASTKRCSELQDEMIALWNFLRDAD
jgi:uncharacterized coiled-coil DUF342 family protein